MNEDGCGKEAKLFAHAGLNLLKSPCLSLGIGLLKIRPESDASPHASGIKE